MIDEFLECQFDDLYINSCLDKVSLELKDYCINNIIPIYELNDKGHSKNHIDYVLKRSFEISKNYDINYNILYIRVMFHDVMCHVDREKHEILSSLYAYDDIFLNKFFDREDMLLIRYAIEDHRASSSRMPRNFYGRILSSADRKVSIKDYLVSSLGFNLGKLEKDDLIEDSYRHAIKKFGKDGYATSKFYVNDDKYEKFLRDIQYLIEHKDIFFVLAEKVYYELMNKSSIE